MDEKTMMYVALAIGAVVVIVLVRGGNSGGIRTLAPLPEGQEDPGKVQAFLGLVDYEKAKLDFGLGKIQAGIESQRIAAAESASIAQVNAQLAAIRAQASAQSNSSFWSTISSIGSALIAAVV